MSEQSEAPYCVGCERLLTANERLVVEVAGLRGAGADERAERAIMSHAEAYRLVEEARQMRAERDAAWFALAETRAALAERAVCRTVDRWIACGLCGGSRRLAGEELETNKLMHGYPHTPDCLLARDPASRGAEVLAAAEDGADALEALLNHFLRYTDHRCEINLDARRSLMALRAALAPAPRAGEGT